MENWSENTNEWKQRRLKQFQGLPLEAKVILSKSRIKQFADYFQGKVHISFSGGKDSTVLLDLVRQVCPNAPAVFVNTGLEYPEILEFIKTIDNVIWLKPKMVFNKVIEKYGYPVVSKKVSRAIKDLQNPTKNNATTRNLYLTGIKKDGSKTKSFKLAKKWICLIDAPFKISDYCCEIMKKQPIYKYEKEFDTKGFIGTMTEDSQTRRASYIATGCNSFNGSIKSRPLAFWKRDDIWEYIKTRELKYSSIYDKGVHNTGCMFCMFGVQLEKEPNRFQLMKKTHPKQYNYCINKLGCGKVLDYININY